MREPRGRLRARGFPTARRPHVQNLIRGDAPDPECSHAVSRPSGPPRRLPLGTFETPPGPASLDLRTQITKRLFVAKMGCRGVRNHCQNRKLIGVGVCIHHSERFLGRRRGWSGRGRSTSTSRSFQCESPALAERTRRPASRSVSPRAPFLPSPRSAPDKSAYAFLPRPPPSAERPSVPPCLQL